MVQATPSHFQATTAQNRLLRIIRWLHFGTIEHLEVRGGVPIFDPPPRVIRQQKFGSGDTSNPSASKNSAEAELVAALIRIGDGIIDSIEVQHGRPFRLTQTLAQVPP